MNNEVFVNIKDFPNYQISNLGRVYNIRKNIFLNPYLNFEKTYYVVKFSGNGKSITYKLHRLLAEYFIPNPDNKPLVDHKDNNKLNNQLSNLRWATCTENSRNKNKLKNTSSDYIGATPYKKTGLWKSQIMIKGNLINVGLFETAEEAGLARDRYIIENNLNETNFYKMNS